MRQKWRKLCLGVLVVAAAGLMAGCDTAPKNTKAGASAYNDLLHSAEEAQKHGEPAEALAYFEKAAKLEPGKKQPWLQMAQMHFDARNYGPAIIAAQEVQLRDNTDITAKTIIAASGLRVAARALEQLRAANVAVTNTIDEARTLSRTMRDVLGEPLLPPPQEVDMHGQPVQAAPQRRWTPPPPAPAPRPNTAPPARPSATPAARATPSDSRRNPFEVLKD